MSQNGKKLRILSHSGTFVNCIRESSQSAQKLLDIIVTNFSHFKDEAKYEDIDGKIVK